MHGVRANRSVKYAGIPAVWAKGGLAACIWVRWERWEGSRMGRYYDRNASTEATDGDEGDGGGLDNAPTFAVDD